MGDCSGSREPVRTLYIEINGNFVFDLQIFTLRTVFIERITFVSRGMGVHRTLDSVCCLWYYVIHLMNRLCSGILTALYWGGGGGRAGQTQQVCRLSCMRFSWLSSVSATEPWEYSFK
jgi:hypothetical protein